MAAGAMADPYAGVGSTVAPPQASQGGSDPYAGVGAAVGPPAATAGPSTPPAAPDLTSNPHGEGTYQMQQQGGGTVGVPFSKVQTAMSQGYNSASNDETMRYLKDLRAAKATGAWDPIKGALKSVVQVPNTVVGWLDSLTDKATAAAQGEQAGAEAKTHDLAPKLQAVENKIAPGITNPMHGTGQQLGGVAEQVAEWLYGEGEARAMIRTSEGMTKVARAMGFLEKHPQLAADASEALKTRLLRVAGTAATTGAGAGAQAALHGASAGDVGTAALEGGVAGGAGSAIAEGFQATRAASAAAEATTPAARQAQAQGAIKDVYKDATRNALQRMNDAQAPALAMTGEPVGEAHFAPVDTDAAAGAVNSAGDAAEQLRNAADPIYKKLDEVSGGTFAAAQKQISRGYALRDSAMISEGEQTIDGILKSKPDELSPQEYAAAKSAWRDSKVLDKLHQTTEGAFNGISEDMAAQEGTGQRLLTKNAGGEGSLQKRLGNLLRKPGMEDDVRRVIGDDGLTNLYRASHLVSDPKLQQSTADVAKEVVKQLATKAAVGAAGDALARSLGVPPGWSEAIGTGAATVMGPATKAILNKVVSSPRVGELMDYAVRHNVTPRIAGGLIAAQIQRESAQSQQQQPQ